MPQPSLVISSLWSCRRPARSLRRAAGRQRSKSVKAASDIFAPLSGEVVAINQRLVEEPGVVNSDPMGAGWFFKLKLARVKDMEGLMDEIAYKALIA